MRKNRHMENVCIVLHEPHYSENIGAAARAACNMGIKELRIVNPQSWEEEKALKLATRHAMKLITKNSFYSSLKEAIDDCGRVIGTTARLGRQRSEALTPRQMATELIAFMNNNRVALVFGPENRGLSNEELRLCHTIVSIPTESDCRSLNLGQSVVIICYELYLATMDPICTPKPKVATIQETEAMYAHLKETLIKIDFIKPDNPDYWMGYIKKFFSQRTLLSRETQLIRGICRQIDWFTRRRIEKMKQDCTSLSIDR